MSSTEIALMERVQAMGTTPLPTVARIYSRWGDHAAGWIATGLVGAVVDRRRRATWLGVTASATLAHGGAVVLKRVVRRRRPWDERVRILVKAPSDLSFPSAHAASTTGAAVALVPIVGVPVAAALATTMAGARVMLGVHYPSDVAAGAAIGLAAGIVTGGLRKAGEVA